MKAARFGSVVRSIVGVALATSASATVYACSDESNTSNDGAGGNGEGGAGGGAAAFADEATFACAPPLPGVLENLTPAVATDYIEVREQVTSRPPAGEEAGAASAPVAVATRGVACATASDKPACEAALRALAVSGDVFASGGWLTDGDIDGPHGPKENKQFVVYTRGDTVGALMGTAEVAAFLGTIDSLEEARLVLASMNLALVCTNDPRKSGWRKNDDGSWDLMIAGTSCGSFIKYRVRYRVAKDGTVTKIARDPSLGTGAVCGRRPAGLAADRVAGGSRRGLAAHFSETAYLEAASVVAFRRLELELRRLGAPDSLVRRARRARIEEIDHARDTAGLARLYGGVVPPLDLPEMEARDLLTIALENAVEGCVRETYGALVSAFQAERATPELRPLLRRIARDEASHAELAHDVARWMNRILSSEQRATIAAAREAALDQLTASLDCEPANDVVRVAGIPSSREALALVEGLGRFLAAA